MGAFALLLVYNTLRRFAPHNFEDLCRFCDFEAPRLLFWLGLQFENQVSSRQQGLLVDFSTPCESERVGAITVWGTSPSDRAHRSRWTSQQRRLKPMNPRRRKVLRAPRTPLSSLRQLREVEVAAIICEDVSGVMFSALKHGIGVPAITWRTKCVWRFSSAPFSCDLQRNDMPGRVRTVSKVHGLLRRKRRSKWGQNRHRPGNALRPWHHWHVQLCPLSVLFAPQPSDYLFPSVLHQMCFHGTPALVRKRENKCHPSTCSPHARCRACGDRCTSVYRFTAKSSLGWWAGLGVAPRCVTLLRESCVEVFVRQLLWLRAVRRWQFWLVEDFGSAVTRVSMSLRHCFSQNHPLQLSER